MAELKRIILEMGTGNDLHGGDYTKAAKRAVQDALHHSSLALFKNVGIDPNSMQIELTLAAQEPDQIDLDAVAATLPYGTGCEGRFERSRSRSRRCRRDCERGRPGPFTAVAQIAAEGPQHDVCLAYGFRLCHGVGALLDPPKVS